MDYQRDAIAKDDRVRFHHCDLEFHEVLLAELGYERVKASVSAARAQLDRLRLFMCTPRRQASTFAEHRRIVDALASRDPGNAGLAMERHLKTVMNELSDFVANHPDVFANGEHVIAAAE
jgi:DNA-binding GntR family transcriptional regulator